MATPTLTRVKEALRAGVCWVYMLSALVWLLTVPSAEASVKRNQASVLNTSARIHATPGIAAVLAILAGAGMLIYGYKLLRAAVFVCGFVLGGLLVALVIEYALVAAPWMATASWLGFLIGGIIGGFMSIWLYSAGVIAIGVLGGILLAFLFNTSVAHKLYPSQPDAMLVILVALFGALGGILAWWIEKPVVILATSFIGATAFVWGIGYFVGKYPSGADLKRFRGKDPSGDWVYDIPQAWWAYLAATLVLFALGVLVQYRKTARGLHHTRRTRSSCSRSHEQSYRLSTSPRYGTAAPAHQAA